ncbi:MAG: RluA family pseudouridine synthase [Bacilli bacterium]|nr:RluA family pseudouridine synthase [Bacilli bacterium]
MNNGKPLNIIYQDEDILVVLKEAGSVVYPDAVGERDSLGNDVISYLGESLEYKPSPVHRLDYHTSGLVIYALNKEINHVLSEEFKNHRIEKKYAGLARKITWKERTVSAPMAYDKKLKKMAVSEEGKEAVTIFSHLRDYDGFSLVEATPITGRSNQIRVHLDYLGSPLVGDDKYGDILLSKQFFLRAISIKLPKLDNYPKISEKIFLAPYLEDLKRYLES